MDSPGDVTSNTYVTKLELVGQIRQQIAFAQASAAARRSWLATGSATS